jgi:hypothetical protein
LHYGSKGANVVLVVSGANVSRPVLERAISGR